MIVYYTRYHIIPSFDSQALLNFAFNCVNGMKNCPEEFKGKSWDGAENGEWKNGRDLLAFDIDNQNKQVAFRIAITDENGELWTTDAALNENDHELQLRLAREKKSISAELDKRFHLPYLFKKLIKDHIAAMDLDLPITEEPIFLNDDNIHIIANLTNGEKKYALPVVYVSHPFNKDDYDLDIFEMSKDMAGSAHVIVEKETATSFKLRELTNGKNAYNGAIDVFYDNDSFRYLKWPELTANQYRYKISQAIYVRLAMRNIDEFSSLSAIRIRNKIRKLEHTNMESERLAFEIETLKDKNKEIEELFELSSEEAKLLQKQVNGLENKVTALMGALNKKNESEGDTAVLLKHSETEFYEDEIKRIILESIRAYLKGFGEEERARRDFHLLNDLLLNNEVSEIGNLLRSAIFQVIRKNRLSKSDVRELEGLGFEIQSGGHNKYLFHNDDRYIVTISNSPSDYREGENLAHDAIKLIFGRT